MAKVTSVLILCTYFTFFGSSVSKEDFHENHSQNEVPSYYFSNEEFPHKKRIIFSTINSWTVQESQFYEYLTRILPKVKNQDLGLQIERYMKKYEDEVVNNIAKWATISKLHLDKASLSWHPFLIFKTLRRLLIDYPALHISLSAKYTNQVPYFIMTPPSEEDINDYATLLVSLAYLSGFKISDFCLGTFGKTQTNITLSATEATVLAEAAFQHKFYSSTLELLLYARSAGKKTKGLDLQSLEEFIKFTIVQHDSNWNSEELLAYDHYTRKIGSVTNYLDNAETFSTKMSYLRANHRVHNATEEVVNIWKSPQYQLICAGKNFQTEKERKSLKCWYHFGSEYILPYKVELMNRDPWIIKVYEFVGPSTVNPIKRYLVETGNDATGRYKDDDPDYHYQRHFVNKFSAVTHFPPDTPDFVLRLERKVSSIANLDAMTPDKEDLLASCSLPGAHFAAHDDSSDDFETLSSGRLSNMLIYMGNTIQGGHTVFYKLGFIVEPEPYTAILWANRKKNTKVEDRNYHGGCPVVLGDKWVSNKWIKGNIQERRCSTNPEE